MDEDIFNLEIRKFLKQVGIISQREIERAVRKAVADGRIKGDEMLTACPRVQIDDIGLDRAIEAEVALS